MPTFTLNPPPIEHALLTYPAPHVLLVTLNRPRALNCINSQGHAELHAVWEWLDAEPSLRVGVLTGVGRAFCAGADLKGKHHSQFQPVLEHAYAIPFYSPVYLIAWKTGTAAMSYLYHPANNHPEWNTRSSTNSSAPMPPSGFGGLARRKGRKPVICAVNGLCLGGGAEMIINSDLVVAASRAVFGLPEVKRGVVALAGALPRLVRTVGKQRAMEMVLTGRMVSAEEAERWGLVNEVVRVAVDVGDEVVSRDVVRRAVAVGVEIAGNSPDAVLVSREGVKLGWEGIGADEATGMLSDTWVKRLYEGENIKEGLRAFVEKRKPVWVDSKL